MAANQEDADEETAEKEAKWHQRDRGFAVGVMLGALLGAGLALMYAPDRGERTRHRLKRRIQRLRDEAADGLDRAGKRATQARRELSRRRRRLEAGIDRAADEARDAFDE